jgi:hypothetical protein
MSGDVVPFKRAPLDGEIILPRESVSVYGTTHPLNALAGDRVHCVVPAGLSIREILDQALKHKPGVYLRSDLIVTIGDENDSWEILEQHWSKVRLKPGTVVTFIPRLQDSGTLRSVLGVVVAIGALILAAPTGGLSLGLVAATGVSMSVASALVAGGIMRAGTLDLDALFTDRGAE